MRAEQLQAWVQQELTQRQWIGTEPLQFSLLSTDAGFRRYYRLNIEPSLLAVDAPTDSEDSRTFVRVAQFLRTQGIGAPKVLAVDYDKGFLLVEDFGDGLLLNQLSPSTVEGLYAKALSTLLQIQQCPYEAHLVPVYDETRLREELILFGDWFVGKLLHYSLSATEQEILDKLFDQLVQSAMEQPRLLVHRDYHSRNLLVRNDKSLGVLDFQGALWGPLTYDLVSLLRDCYVCWPLEDVQRWAITYGEMAVEAGLVSSFQQQDYLRWFDWMGLQRHLKVLGIFARLSLRDHKPGYLNDLPLVVRYVLEVAANYTLLTPFVAWFKAQLLPRMQTQEWYTDYTKAGE